VRSAGDPCREQLRLSDGSVAWADHTNNGDIWTRPQPIGLAAQIRQELNTAQFDQAFSAGFGLTQRQAVEIARDQHGASPQRS
jgi:hypothetical protein